MLQQTRVAAVVPYYERFLERFPDVESLARAPERQVLALWSGLGYYSRARNLHRAARRIVQEGAFPSDYASLRALPGVGDYTAAAIASIAYGLPHAVLDGNVMRVLARLSNDSGDIAATATRRRLLTLAEELLDRRCPGAFNQALMELGATVCVPGEPDCTHCPLSTVCQACRLGTQRELPVKRRAGSPIRVEKILLRIERNGKLLLWQRPADSPRLAGFWELPEAGQLARARIVAELGDFRHSITNHDYRIKVVAASVHGSPRGFAWVDRRQLGRIPLSTSARKALSTAGSRVV